MSSATGGLKELHKVHLELDDCRKQLETGPRRVAAHERLVAKKQAEIDTQKAKITDLQKAADQKNLQFRTNEQQIADLKAKLNQAASNKEFDIIKGQIAADNESNATLEDEYLELLEEVDAGRTHLAELQNELSEAEASVKKVKDEFAALQPKLNSQAEELEGELREAEKCIPTKMMEQYRRLVGAHGAASIATVEGSACSECFVELSPQNLVEIRSAHIVVCKSCGRLLYAADEE